MTRPDAETREAPRLAVALAALALQALVWALVARGVLPGALAFALHLASAVLSGLTYPGWVRRRPRARVTAPLSRPALPGLPADAPLPALLAQGPPPHEHALGFLALALAFLFPVVGAAGVLVAAVARARGSGSFERVVAQYRELVEASHPVEEIAADARERLAEESWSALEIRPFVDIVGAADHEDDLATSAIESTSLLEQHTACRLLRHALSSAVPSTRYYAARALARVEERLDTELERCIADRRRRPDDAGVALALARARAAYGDLAAGDDPLVGLHLEEARKLLESVHGRLTGEQGDEGLALLGRVSLRLGAMERARELFDELVWRGTRRVEVYRGLAVCLHAQRDYVGLRRTLGTARERCPGSRMVAEMCATWGVEA